MSRYYKILYEAGKIKQREIQAKPGRNADHITEVQTFGPAQELLEEEYAKGAITQAEYDKRINILKEQNIGDSAGNFQDISDSANQTKKNVVEAKNKALEKLEKFNYDYVLKIFKNIKTRFLNNIKMFFFSAHPHLVGPFY